MGRIHPGSKLILALFFCVGITACGGSKRFDVRQKPARPFNTYGQVEVRDFTVDGIERLGPDQKSKALNIAREMTEYLRERLAGRELFLGEGPKIIIRGNVIGFDPGSKAARYWVGFGAGEGEIVVDVSFTDSGGSLVANGNSRGTVSGGWFGGSTSSAAKRVIRALTNFIEDNYEELQ